RFLGTIIRQLPRAAARFLSVAVPKQVEGAPLVGALGEGTHKGCPYERRENHKRHGDRDWGWSRWAAFSLLGISLLALPSCGKVGAKSDSSAVITVGVTKVARKSLARQITLSSELVPFQEIDVYAKESGFVKKLYVDYGSRVQKDQLLATLEIPELQLQVKEDDAAVRNAAAQIPYSQ